jgi:hypothetical protein
MDMIIESSATADFSHVEGQLPFYFASKSSVIRHVLAILVGE